MNERGLRILEQYDFKVLSTRRGRGSFICETDQGLKLVMEVGGQVNKLKFQNQVLQHLQEEGVQRVDRIVENSEGNLVSVDRDETAYIVKDWFDGRECDTRSEDDILKAVQNLGRLHLSMQLPMEEEYGPYVGGELENEFGRRTRELKKVRSFIQGRQGKNDFERRYLDSYAMFYEQAMESMKDLQNSGLGKLLQKSREEGWVCHGEYNQHHILMCRSGIATVDFSRCRYDIQASDLYQFLRKILEKQNWSVRMGMGILEEYDRIRGLGPEEQEYLRIRLAYPEKFWKLANHYYNHNKAWISGKSVEKLEMLVRQQEKKNQFLKILE